MFSLLKFLYKNIQDILKMSSQWPMDPIVDLGKFSILDGWKNIVIEIEKAVSDPLKFNHLKWKPLKPKMLLYFK